MKKILVLVVVAILMTGGLVLMSCGDTCPGGNKSGGAGNCYIDVSDPDNHVLNYCTRFVFDCLPGTADRCQCSS